MHEDFDSNQNLKEVYLLGGKLGNYKQHILQIKIELIKRLYSSRFWFTYRKDFPQLMENTEYTSDTGWGCMIRAGQMAWAQMLRKHNSDESYIAKELEEILKTFADDDDGEWKNLSHKDDELILDKEVKIQYPYSIQKIAYVSKNLFNVKPGEWYTPNLILYSLNALHEKCSPEKAKNLKMVIFNDSSMFLDRLTSTMQGIEPICQHIKTIVEEQKEERKELVCPKCLSETNTKEEYSLGIFVLTRLGLDSINKSYLIQLEDLMKLIYFQGILGGKPKSALYILGRIDEHYVVMDPHLVQRASQGKNFHSSYNSYFNKQKVQMLRRNKLDTSMAICFYVRNQKELTQFWNQMELINKKYEDEFFIRLNKITPDYMIVPPHIDEGMIFELDDL